MKSSITFFDSLENSKRGTLRGISIFPIFIAINYLFYTYVLKIKYNYYTQFLFGLLIVSAIGIHTPSSANKAIVYGALLGLVIYGTSTLTLTDLDCKDKISNKKTCIYLLWGVVTTSILSVILYFVLRQYRYLLYI